ncbi:hypothetical protein D3C78_833980 [compost metagenome]
MLEEAEAGFPIATLRIKGSSLQSFTFGLISNSLMLTHILGSWVAVTVIRTYLPVTAFWSV